MRNRMTVIHTGVKTLVAVRCAGVAELLAQANVFGALVSVVDKQAGPADSWLVVVRRGRGAAGR